MMLIRLPALRHVAPPPARHVAQTLARWALCIPLALAIHGHAHAQCSVLGDPLQGGASGCTPSSTVVTQPRQTSAQSAAQSWEAAKAQPGVGQQVCAFFDPRTNRCLSERPNTAAYDRALSTGVHAAMMGMQVQADALHMARQQGLLGAAGSAGQNPAAFLPPGVAAALPQNLQTGLQQLSGAAPATGMPSASLTSSTPSTPTPSSASSPHCLERQLNAVQASQGRAPTPQEVRSALMACSGTP